MGPTRVYGARAEKPLQNADFAMKQTNICRLSGDINYYTQLTALMHFVTRHDRFRFGGQKVKVQGLGGIKFVGNITLRVKAYST